ncbi:hypothetical protein BDV97DRAFT_42914 [Delphinella strobiligena]|nr:hypothetical protein BDV97DRAFT_42914 [Delphinella strobiligena]
MSNPTHVTSDGDGGAEPEETNNQSGSGPLPSSSTAMPKPIPNLENTHRLDTPISPTLTRFPAQGLNFPPQGPHLPPQGPQFPAQAPQFPAQAPHFSAQRPHFPAQGPHVSTQSLPETSTPEPPRVFDGVNYGGRPPPGIWLRNSKTHETQHFCWLVPLVNDSLPNLRIASKRVGRIHAFIWKECCSCSQSLAFYVQKGATVACTTGLIAK